MSLALVLALVGLKMLTHGWLKAVLGPNFNLFLLLVVLASWRRACWPRGSAR